MIITKTPFRMSFFGGGTDMDFFFKENGGSVISTTFDKYCYVNVRHLPRFFNFTSEITYSKIERVQKTEEILHPAVREAMRYLNMHEIRLMYEADLPARSGLGTSSSFAVGMLNAFYALKGKYVDKKKLAKDAIYLERVLCKEQGGWQDQVAASYGGLNRIYFQGNDFIVKPIIISTDKKEQLNKNLMLYFTGFTHFSSEIQEYAKKQNKTSQLKEMLDLVDCAETVLTNDSSDLHEFGKLLDITWKLKRQTNHKISTDFIDNIYDAAKRAGALGGKLLGAGGGGFLLFYVPPENQESVRKTLDKLLYVPFLFETEGTQIIYYAPEDHE